MMISSLVIFSVGMGSGLYQGLIHVGAAVAEELPGFADFGNHIEVEVGGEDFVFVARRLGEDAAARIAEVARAVEFADVPGGFGAHAVDGADEITVGDGVAGCSSFHRYSLRPATVAEGLKTISAPANPRARAPSGKWRS